MRWRAKEPFNSYSHLLGVVLSIAGLVALVVQSHGQSLRVIGFSIYGACKAGMDNFAKTGALEFGDYGIRINSIAPDVIDTGIGIDQLHTLHICLERHRSARFLSVSRLNPAADFGAIDGSLVDVEIQIDG